jgi:hypothetical protein
MYEIAQHASATGAIIIILASVALAVTDKLLTFRSSFHRGATMLAIVALAGAAFLLTRPATPASSVVNGTYQNSCCEPITLKDGVLITAHFRVPFKLRLMKYGLDTDMDRKVEVRSGKLVLSSRTGSEGFVFSDDLHAFTLCEGTCGAGHQFEFKRL